MLGYCGTLVGAELGFEGQLGLDAAGEWRLGADLDAFTAHLFYPEGADGSPITAIVSGRARAAGALGDDAVPLTLHARVDAVPAAWRAPPPASRRSSSSRACAPTWCGIAAGLGGRAGRRGGAGASVRGGATHGSQRRGCCVRSSPRTDMRLLEPSPPSPPPALPPSLSLARSPCPSLLSPVCFPYRPVDGKLAAVEGGESRQFFSMRGEEMLRKSRTRRNAAAARRRGSRRTAGRARPAAGQAGLSRSENGRSEKHPSDSLRIQCDFLMKIPFLKIGYIIYGEGT